MATYKNLELRDNILNDALKLMEENPNLSYDAAYEQAKQNLIGNQEINSFVFKPLTTSINISSNSKEQIKEDVEDPYLEDIKKRLKDDIDVEKYTEEQLEEYIISKEMGLDITKFADPGYNPDQIKYISMQVLVGKPIDKFIGNYTFDPEREIVIESLDAEK